MSWPRGARSWPGGEALPWSSLTPDRQRRLDAALCREADMAFRRRARILADYLELADGQALLDAGCGMGFHLRTLGGLAALRLAGVDRATDRLAWARRAGVEAELCRADLGRLPFADRTFDRVLLSEVLEHLEDEGGALAELRRVLAPGGVLAISVPHADYPWCWDPINRAWALLGGAPLRSGPLVGIWTHHLRLYRPAGLVRVVKEAGFAVEAVEEATHHAFPFSHFLLYGLGKRLVEGRLLPAAWRRGTDRAAGGAHGGEGRNPVALGIAVLRAVDRLNERPAARRRRTFVNVLLKARRPDGGP